MRSYVRWSESKLERDDDGDLRLTVFVNLQGHAARLLRDRLRSAFAGRDDVLALGVEASPEPEVWESPTASEVVIVFKSSVVDEESGWVRSTVESACREAHAAGQTEIARDEKLDSWLRDLSRKVD